MIVATVTALLLLFGGSSLEHYLLNIKKPAKQAIANRETYEAVHDLSKQLGKQLKKQYEQQHELREAFVDLHHQYDVRREDADQVLERIMERRDQVQSRILDTREAMKALMTEEEWQAVFEPL